MGGPTIEKPVNRDVRQMMEKLNPQLEEQLSSRSEGHLLWSSSPLKAISYRSQLVNGNIYFIKVRAQLGRTFVYYHVKVYQDFKGNLSLVGIEGPMRIDDKIGVF